MPAPNSLQQMQREIRVAAPKPLVLEEGFAPFRIANNLLGSISNFVFMGPLAISAITGITKWFNKGDTPGALKKIGDVSGLLEKPLTELPQAAADALGKNTATNAIATVGSGVGEFAKKTLGKGLTTRLAQNSLSTLAVYGTMAASEGINAALEVGQQTRGLMQMQFELTGKMPSAAEVDLGSDKLHPLVLEVRKELTGGKALLGKGLKIGGTITNAAMMLMGKARGTGWKSFLLPMAVSMGSGMVANAITSSNTALAAHRELHAHFAQNGRAPESAYVALIGGLAKNSNEQMIHLFAKQCADKQLRPDAVLKMVAETSFFKQKMEQNAQSRKHGFVFKAIAGVGLCALAGAAYKNRAALGSWVSRVTGNGSAAPSFTSALTPAVVR